jgi:4-amino-4-deoxy-L-arabinose transferase-like glycosyltransferase
LNSNFKALLSRHWQLAGLLLGAFLIAVSQGTYTNWDAQLEYEAASNVINRGFPIVTTGLMINQPPLGFYMDAPVFHFVGLSYLNGVSAITAFGLGCVALVYILGTIFYGKNTGLVAAALFSVVPWHVYLSRIFLIDNQFLFFSLLTLLVGVLAVRRRSDKLLAVSGIVFALAFLTKVFAVFIIVPLLIIYLQRKSSLFRLTSKRLLLFFMPTIMLQSVWYGVFANQNFVAVYFSSDFTHPVLVDNPSLVFLPITLVKAAGWFLLAAAVLALALHLAFRHMFAGRFSFDVVCLVTVLTVGAANLLLVFGFHLTVPYVSVIKYNYVALPFLCLLSGSLEDKSTRLISDGKLKSRAGVAKLIFTGVGAVLLLASLIWSVVFLVQWWGFVAFGVDSVTYYGFNTYSAPMTDFQLIHYAGLGVIMVTLMVAFWGNWLHKRLSGYVLFV